MTDVPGGREVRVDDPLGVGLVIAVRTGDVDALRRFIRDDPELANARLVGRRPGSRTPLHVVTDWPGYFPNGPAIVRTLIEAGADLNARTTSGSSQPDPGETPLHWAASNDDVDVAEVLIVAGADIEAPDGSIGSPLDNAIGYSCWHVARLLVTRGASVDKLWHAGALGMLARLEALAGEDPPAEEVSQAFWHACAAGQRRAAEYLLSRGADMNWVPDYAEGTPLDAADGLGTRQENVITWLRDLGARSSRSDES